MLTYGICPPLAEESLLHTNPIVAMKRYRKSFFLDAYLYKWLTLLGGFHHITFYQENGTDTTPALCQKAKHQGLIDYKMPSQDNVYDKCNNLIEFHGERTMEENASVITTSSIDKENDWKNVFTPNLKPMMKSSSPPLSERLHNLRAAMREIIQPIHDNDVIHAKEPLPTISNIISPVKSQQTSPLPTISNIISPVKSQQTSPYCATEMEEITASTPLEKLNMKSCGIKVHPLK